MMMMMSCLQDEVDSAMPVIQTIRSKIKLMQLMRTFRQMVGSQYSRYKSASRGPCSVGMIMTMLEWEGEAPKGFPDDFISLADHQDHRSFSLLLHPPSRPSIIRTHRPTSQHTLSLLIGESETAVKMPRFTAL